MSPKVNRVIKTASFPGRYDHLIKISEFVTQAANNIGFKDDAIYAIQMAVDEACTNIIEHAYASEGQGDIQCTCLIRDNELTIILHDHGKPFDPSRIPEPNVFSRLEDRQSGGLGLYFMRQMMDKVEFRFDPPSGSDPGGNVLTLIKRKES